MLRLQGFPRHPELRQRPFIIVAAALAALLVLAVGVYAYDSSRSDRIADGVRVGGVDVGGLSRAAARDKLETVLLAQLRAPIVVSHGTQVFRLGPREARIGANVEGMVDAAIARSRRGSILTRTFRDVTGGSVHANLRPLVSYSRAAVLRLVDRVRRHVDRDPQAPSVHFTTTRLVRVPGHDGLAVDAHALRAQIDAAVVTPGAPRSFVAVTHHITPKITDADLRRQYATALIVDRSGFRLRLFKHFKLVKSYPIAVGRQGLETPAGEYTINDRQINPSWHVPNSPWAGKLAGKVIPPGPDDPIKARWLGFYNGAGIHGTTEDSSIGTAASHGCIRMHIPDVIDLFPRVPLGTPIYVA